MNAVHRYNITAADNETFADLSKECSRMELLKPPLTTICGVLFLILSLFAIIANTLVLFIIFKMKTKRSRSMVILSSLATSDLLVGAILGPITGWQQLNIHALSNCVIDQVRGYFVVLLVGSSATTLAVVSYDRYLLLSKLTNYNKHMTRYKAIVLLVLCWVIPALIPLIRQIKAYVYLVFMFILFVSPLFALGFFYYLIMRAVNQKENSLKNRNSNKKIKPDYGSSQPSASDGTSGTTGTTGTMDFNASSGYIPSARRVKKQIRLARIVIFLIICYVLCITPMNIWISLELIQLNGKNYAYQMTYVVTMLLMQVNSCINPVIYFSRNPDFKKGLKKLFKQSPKSNVTMNSVIKRQQDEVTTDTEHEV